MDGFNEGGTFSSVGIGSPPFEMMEGTSKNIVCPEHGEDGVCIALSTGLSTPTLGPWCIMT